MTSTVTLGDEHDDRLHAALLAVLDEMGADLEATEWALAGSQEVETRQVVVGDAQIEITAETYIGLRLTGRREVVEMVAARVRDRLA